MTKPKSKSNANARKVARKSTKPKSSTRPASWPVSFAGSSGSIWYPSKPIKGGSIASRMARFPPLPWRRDAMREKRRTGGTLTNTSIGDEIAHLRDFDLKGLRARWQSVFQRSAPAHLPRHLLFAILAYRIQADHLGDLDYKTRQFLDETDATGSGSATSARLVNFDQKRTELTAGTVLVRAWDRKEHRVMVMANGFAWNGQTYDSLSKVAFAITGTKWNGPRFFGLRERKDRSAMEARL